MKAGHGKALEPYLPPHTSGTLSTEAHFPPNVFYMLRFGPASQIIPKAASSVSDWDEKTLFYYESMGVRFHFMA